MACYSLIFIFGMYIRSGIICTICKPILVIYIFILKEMVSKDLIQYIISILFFNIQFKIYILIEKKNASLLMYGCNDLKFEII